MNLVTYEILSLIFQSTLAVISEPNRLADVCPGFTLNEEGLTVLTWDLYQSSIDEIRPELNRHLFIERQKQIKYNARLDYKNEVLRVFKEAYRYRMITYYTKLREFGLDDIMRKLDELGFLDERFDSEVYIYEEEARRLLAKRLCAISYKSDIKLLIEEGIIKASDVPYIEI